MDSRPMWQPGKIKQGVWGTTGVSTPRYDIALNEIGNYGPVAYRAAGARVLNQLKTRDHAGVAMIA